MKKSEKILKSIEGESKEEIEKDLLESFGFIWITDIGTHGDGSLLIEQGLDEYKDYELWVDWETKRICLYSPAEDLNIIEGELTKEEEELYYK
jgi:hypothetical protein